MLDAIGNNKHVERACTGEISAQDQINKVIFSYEWTCLLLICVLLMGMNEFVWTECRMQLTRCYPLMFLRVIWTSSSKKSFLLQFAKTSKLLTVSWVQKWHHELLLYLLGSFLEPVKQRETKSSFAIDVEQFWRENQWVFFFFFCHFSFHHQIFRVISGIMVVLSAPLFLPGKTKKN